MASALFHSTASSSRHAVRCFSTASNPRASILFQLGALSNARETQHFNKISKLDRFEHSPNLKLIKTSEIDPFPVPIERLIQNATPRQNDAPSEPARPAFRRAETSAAWDSRALAAGRAILAEAAHQRSRMARLAERARRRELRQTQVLHQHIAALAKERRRMQEEMRSAGFLILLSITAATGCALWTFWPAERTIDSAELGRRLAETASASIPLPSITPASEAVAGAGAVPATAATTGEPTVAPPWAVKEEAVTTASASAGSWSHLLWKRQ